MWDKKRSQENTFISQAHDRSLLQICVTTWTNFRSVAVARRRACKSRQVTRVDPASERGTCRLAASPPRLAFEF